jgi:hypothetical protein
MFALLCGAAGGPEAAAAGPESDTRPFEDSIEEYVRLHEQVRASLPPVDVSAEPRTILRASHQLAAAIRDARQAAQRGDVFNPVVAANFRARIDYALRDHDRRKKVLDQLTEVEDDEDERPKAGWVPAVNGTLDWFATGGTPPSIIKALPDLPDELQYRFVGLDLLLLDVDANLIVDILPAAISAR